MGCKLADRMVEEKPSIFQIYRCLVSIILLVLGHIVHNIIFLRIDKDHLELDNEYVPLWPVFRSKTYNGSYRQFEWKKINYPEEFCDPICLIKKLINVSEDQRKARSQLTHWFITTRGQVGSASNRSVISGWIKRVFVMNDIGSSSGSIILAVASSKFTKRFPLDFVLQGKNW